MRKAVRLVVAGTLVACGIAVVSTVSAEPANRVGDLVWVDVNKNGVQDAGEPGAPGVAVVVKDGKGNPVGGAITDSKGNYAVGGLPDASFTVCFGLINLPAGYADFHATRANAGDDTRDSDADPATGCTGPVTLGPGAAENLAVDAGIVSPPNTLGGAVWVDANKNGLQDTGEPWIPGVSVVIKDGRGNQIGVSTTGMNGRYRVDNLPDGTFTVCFGMSTLPDAYADNLITKPNAGDDITDSDVDQTTGCTAPVNLGPDNRENLTVDAGTVAPTNRLGDYVWIDGNRNGIQEPREPGVLGVTVVLQAGGVAVARTATNENGRYLFTNLPDGAYRVCFDLGALPAAVADYTVTQANASDGTEPDIDSDADSTGCTPATTLGVGRRANFGLDVGLVAVASWVVRLSGIPAIGCAPANRADTRWIVAGCRHGTPEVPLVGPRLSPRNKHLSHQVEAPLRTGEAAVRSESCVRC